MFFRHEVERHPLSFLAFGIGPRICLGIHKTVKLRKKLYNVTLHFKGMKFALLQIKLVLIKILKTYELEVTDSTPKYLEFVEGILKTSKHDVPILFKPRNQ